ncbi:MAG: EVE domain-containing protein [Gemmataceae bacterium]
MAYWLFKEEPDHYSFTDLERDGSTLWDGVANNMALKNLRQVKPGDRVLFYHTGKEKTVVGEMLILTEPRNEHQANGRRSVSVEVAPVRRLPQPISLARIKADPALKDWDLVRLPRLSVMAVTAAQWKRIEEMSKD